MKWEIVTAPVKAIWDMVFWHADQIIVPYDIRSYLPRPCGRTLSPIYRGPMRTPRLLGFQHQLDWTSQSKHWVSITFSEVSRWDKIKMRNREIGSAFVDPS